MAAVHERYQLIMDGLKQVKMSAAAAVEAIFDPLLYKKDPTGEWHKRVKKVVHGVALECLENAYALIGAELESRRAGTKEIAHERYETALKELLINSIDANDFSVDPHPTINEGDSGAWMPVWLYVRADDAGVGHVEHRPSEDIGQCGNCERYFDDDSQLLDIEHIHQRVSPGEEMPYGECPHCRSLVYMLKKEN